jgi:hypothetical protein
MNRTIKDATVNRYHYNSRGRLVRRLDDFVAAYTFAEGSRPSTALRPMSSSANDDNRTGTIQTEPAPANAGAKRLGRYNVSGYGDPCGTQCRRVISGKRRRVSANRFAGVDACMLDEETLAFCP